MKGLSDTYLTMAFSCQDHEVGEEHVVHFWPKRTRGVSRYPITIGRSVRYRKEYTVQHEHKYKAQAQAQHERTQSKRSQQLAVEAKA